MLLLKHLHSPPQPDVGQAYYIEAYYRKFPDPVDRDDMEHEL